LPCEEKDREKERGRERERERERKREREKNKEGAKVDSLRPKCVVAGAGPKPYRGASLIGNFPLPSFPLGAGRKPTLFVHSKKMSDDLHV
jgi:hypothetical protein